MTDTQHSRERIVGISLTEAGTALKGPGACIPEKLMAVINFSLEKVVALKGLSEYLIGAPAITDTSMGGK